MKYCRSGTREAINHLATIVCQSTDAIVSFDKNGQIRSWNHGAAQLLGHTDLVAIGQKAELILPNAGTARDTVKLIESGEHQRFDTQLLHQAGHHIDVSANLAPLRHGARHVWELDIEQDQGRLYFFDKVQRFTTRRSLANEEASLLKDTRLGVSQRIRVIDVQQRALFIHEEHSEHSRSGGRPE